MPRVEKVDLLKAVRDFLKAGVASLHNRVWVTIQDADGSEYIPTEAACPFATVSDGGQGVTPETSKMSDCDQLVRVRVYVQNLRDVEAPVVGHAGSGELGAADYQDLVADLLAHDVTLGTRITGVDQALLKTLPAVGTVGTDEGKWVAAAGDVLMGYTFERDDA
jgi:hypothetical protein